MCVTDSGMVYGVQYSCLTQWLWSHFTHHVSRFTHHVSPTRGAFFMPIDLRPAGEAWTQADLRRLTETMIQEMREAIAGCTDADVTFVPDDPKANDTYADDPSLVRLSWTLGHVIVHTTASAE